MAGVPSEHKTRKETDFQSTGPAGQGGRPTHPQCVSFLVTVTKQLGEGWVYSGSVSEVLVCGHLAAWSLGLWEGVVERSC